MIIWSVARGTRKCKGSFGNDGLWLVFWRLVGEIRRLVRGDRSVSIGHNRPVEVAIQFQY